MYNWVSSSKFIELYDHRHTPILDFCHQLKNFPCVRLQISDLLHSCEKLLELGELPFTLLLNSIYCIYSDFCRSFYLKNHSFVPFVFHLYYWICAQVSFAYFS